MVRWGCSQPEPLPTLKKEREERVTRQELGPLAKIGSQPLALLQEGTIK